MKRPKKRNVNEGAMLPLESYSRQLIFHKTNEKIYGFSRSFFEFLLDNKSKFSTRTSAAHRQRIARNLLFLQLYADAHIVRDVYM